MRYRDLRTPQPTIYFPLRQSVFPFAPTTLVIRTAGPPADAIQPTRRALDAADPSVAVLDVAPFTTFLERPLAQPRLNALVLMLFAGTATALAAAGLFASMAAMVQHRTHEIGVRMALGATAANIRRLVAGRGLFIAGAGAAVGLASAASFGHFLRALLYETSPTDPATMSFVAALVLCVAGVATLIPARMGGHTNPARVLQAGAANHFSAL
jgi:putative ABC transport system permease protein